MSKIFNPLTDRTVQTEVITVSNDGNSLVATASIDNTTVGECAKCKGRMTTSTIVNGDAVHFCPKCRVASPIPN